MNFFKNLFSTAPKNVSINEEIQSYVDFAKMVDEKTYRAGNVLWVAHPSEGIRCEVHSKKKGEAGVSVKSYHERTDSAIPYRSCPLSLLKYASDPDFGINKEWRKSVESYWASMNQKIKKGQTYTVFGNPNIDRVTVESITRSNVVGQCLGNPVKVSKLQLGFIVPVPVPQTSEISQ